MDTTAYRDRRVLEVMTPAVVYITMDVATALELPFSVARLALKRLVR